MNTARRERVAKARRRTPCRNDNSVGPDDVAELIFTIANSEGLGTVGAITLLEMVATSVLYGSVKPGGDEHVLKVITEGIAKKLAELRSADVARRQSAAL